MHAGEHTPPPTMMARFGNLANVRLFLRKNLALLPGAVADSVVQEMFLRKKPAAFGAEQVVAHHQDSCQASRPLLSCC